MLYQILRHLGTISRGFNICQANNAMIQSTSIRLKLFVPAPTTLHMACICWTRMSQYSYVQCILTPSPFIFWLLSIIKLKEALAI